MIKVKMDSPQPVLLINSNKTNLDCITSSEMCGNGQPMHGTKMMPSQTISNVLRKEDHICVTNPIATDTDVLPGHKTLLIARLVILVSGVLKIFNVSLAGHFRMNKFTTVIGTIEQLY